MTAVFRRGEKRGTAAFPGLSFTQKRSPGGRGICRLFLLVIFGKAKLLQEEGKLSVGKLARNS